MNKLRVQPDTIRNISSASAFQGALEAKASITTLVSRTILILPLVFLPS